MLGTSNQSDPEVIPTRRPFGGSKFLAAWDFPYFFMGTQKKDVEDESEVTSAIYCHIDFLHVMRQP